VARQSEANVTLFCVQPVEIDVSDENEALHPRVEQSGDELLNVEGYLKALSEKYSDGEVMVDWAASVGVPEEEIVAYALDEGVDLIAMSTHGRTGLSRLLYGSVAESVLRNTAGAVLVVRPE
jgi:nucleotide-binding universal stress UspA family protein